MSITAEAFIEIMSENDGDIKATAEALGIALSTAYSYSSRYKEEIQQRVRDRMTLASFKAVGVVEDSMVADNSTQKGELRLKAATEVLDRSGVTKHTQVDVNVGGDTNGLFILPAKAEVPKNPEE